LSFSFIVPIITNRDLSKPDDKAKHDKSIKAKIDGVSQRAYDLIVTLQPCASNGAQSHLAQVQELDNTDKHRLLLAAAASTEISGFNFRDEQGNVTLAPHNTFLPLDDGTLLKFGDVPPDYRPPNLVRAVAFMEPAPLQQQPVGPALRQLSRQTRQTVMLFAGCF
jgi:hypothetical protein